VTPPNEPNKRAVIGATEVIVAIITTVGVVAAASITALASPSAKDAAPVSTPSASGPAREWPHEWRRHPAPFDRGPRRPFWLRHCPADDRRRRPPWPHREDTFPPRPNPPGPPSYRPAFQGRLALRLTDDGLLLRRLDDAATEDLRRPDLVATRRR